MTTHRDTSNWIRHDGRNFLCNARGYGLESKDVNERIVQSKVPTKKHEAEALREELK